MGDGVKVSGHSDHNYLTACVWAKLFLRSLSKGQYHSVSDSFRLANKPKENIGRATNERVDGTSSEELIKEGRLYATTVIRSAMVEGYNNL